MSRRTQVNLCITLSLFAGCLFVEKAQSSEKDSNSAESRVKAALGSNRGDPKYDKRSDQNGDGFINALDIVTLRRSATPSTSSHSPITPTTSSEQIVVDPIVSVVRPNGIGCVLFLIRHNVTPILAYTLDVTFDPLPAATGTITADSAATNFFDPRNLITAAGRTRDPFFSVIQDDGDAGVLINTITADNSSVLAADGINDVLAQVYFRASSDASGVFMMNLGAASALSDSNAVAIPFTFTPASISIGDHATCDVPTVSFWGLIVLGALIVASAGVVIHRKQRTHLSFVISTLHGNAGEGGQ